MGRLLVFLIAVISFTLITRATLYTSSTPFLAKPHSLLNFTSFSSPPSIPGLNESDLTSTTKKATFNFTAAKDNITDQNQPQHLLLPEQKSLFIKPEINVSQKQSQA